MISKSMAFPMFICIALPWVRNSLTSYETFKQRPWYRRRFSNIIDSKRNKWTKLGWFFKLILYISQPMHELRHGIYIHNWVREQSQVPGKWKHYKWKVKNANESRRSQPSKPLLFWSTQQYCEPKTACEFITNLDKFLEFSRKYPFLLCPKRMEVETIEKLCDIFASDELRVWPEMC